MLAPHHTPAFPIWKEHELKRFVVALALGAGLLAGLQGASVARADDCPRGRCTVPPPVVVPVPECRDRCGIVTVIVVPPPNEDPCRGGRAC